MKCITIEKHGGKWTLTRHDCNSTLQASTGSTDVVKWKIKMSVEVTKMQTDHGFLRANCNEFALNVFMSLWIIHVSYNCLNMNKLCTDLKAFSIPAKLIVWCNMIYVAFC